MKTHKQLKIMHPLYVAELDNEVRIEVYGDYAIGSDGKTYYHVGCEDGDLLKTVGWSDEISEAVVLEVTPANC
ncbi:MAG: hypothetical protein NC110_04245 [Ruminococcus sp.]|nr:hypothetical protein [Ruminococcus sp.]